MKSGKLSTSPLTRTTGKRDLIILLGEFKPDPGRHIAYISLPRLYIQSRMEPLLSYRHS